MKTGRRIKIEKKRRQSHAEREKKIESCGNDADGIGGSYFSIVNRFFEQNVGISNAGLHFLTTFLVIQTICMFVFYNVIKPNLKQTILETEKRYQLI